MRPALPLLHEEDMTDFTLTAPIYSPTEGVLFSAFGIDRGYVACVLSFEAACEQLGAAHQDGEQMLLAFKLNQQRIARAIGNKTPPKEGQRVTLEADDFA